MKKIYSLLALVMLFFTSTSVVKAEKRYGVDGGNIANAAAWTEAQADVPFVLQTGKLLGGSEDFVTATGKSRFITEQNLFTLVATGETNADGEAVWNLKRVATGEFLASGSYSFTDTQTRAWKFCVKQAVAYSADQINATYPDWMVEDWTSATNVEGAIQSQLVFVDAACVADTSVTKKTGTTFLLSNDQGKTPSFGNNYTSNTWELYSVVELTGAEYLQDAMSEIFPNDTADLYNPGTEPGQISQELYDELIGSYDAVNALIEEGSTDQAACEAAVQRCVDAIAAAKAGAVKVKEGYYYFKGNRNDGNNGTYDDGTGLHWTYGSDWTKPEVLDLENAKFVWYLKPDPANDGAYFIQNYYTKHYIGVATVRGAYVKSTEEPEESYLIYPQDKDDFIIESTTLKAAPIKGWNGEDLTCLHQPGDHNNVVMWTTDAPASGWVFLNVPMEQVEALEDQIEQAKLNEAAQAELEKAQTAYESGFYYPNYIKGVESVWTNAQEPSEGPLSAAVDGDPTTFFHTNWHADSAPTDWHYLAADLGEAVSQVQLGIAVRKNGNNYLVSNAPTVVQLYGSNVDPREGQEEGVYNEDVWEEIAGTTLDTLVYDQSCMYAGTAVANSKAIKVFDLGAAYRFIKVEPRRRGTTDMNPGNWWNCGEIELTSSEKKEGMIAAIPAEVRQALENAMATVSAELESESATQASIDALAAAYKNFMDSYPDPKKATDAIAAAKAQYDAAEEGDQLGYFQTGAKDELKAVIDAQEAKIKDVMTLAEVNAVVEAINNAMAAFNGKLNKPADGYYYVQCETESTQSGSAAKAYMYAGGNGARVKWNQPTDADVDLTTMPQMVWKLTNKADGTFTLQNALTGEYMNNPKKNNVAMTMSTEADTCALSLQSAKVPGIFNIVLAESIYANAQPGTNNLVTWSAANGLDNSAFTFVEADLDNYAGYLRWYVAANKNQIITLPVDVTLTDKDGAYSVIGRNGNSLELKKLSGEVKGGTPFIFAETTGETFFEFETTAADYEAIAANWATEAQTVNGLAGTLAGVEELPVDFGILYQGTTFVNSKKGEGVGNNSGYLTPEVPATTETGDLSIAIDGTIDAINDIISAQEGAIVNVYNLNGVKVRSNVKSANDLNGLPAGLYIMGNKKVLVK